jgi:4-hydroxy-3-methylbut-2-enyl diphosphate reductase
MPSDGPTSSPPTGSSEGPGAVFGSGVVERVRAEGNVWNLPAGQLVLPRTFGFCRGVQRALAMLQQAVEDARKTGKRLFLLGQIIHNPWVNQRFAAWGVRILTDRELENPAALISPEDCAIIPAFGVRPEAERRLRTIGCRIIDTSCGDVRRLWAWAQRAVANGRGVLIFGRARHDETVVTKSRLADAGSKYLVVHNLPEVQRFCDMITGEAPAADFAGAFGPEATNAESIEPFENLAQVSQTTMLYDETMEVRRLLRRAFQRRFGDDEAERRLLFEPTVCRATQDRQSDAVELCSSGLDLAIVVGGFGSSNTRHLYELARQYAPAYFIESAEAITSAGELRSFDPQREQEDIVTNWLPRRRPLRIGVLAGASSPEAVVGEVLQHLASFLM